MSWNHGTLDLRRYRCQHGSTDRRDSPGKYEQFRRDRCELWRSDGTVDGTHIVRDIWPGAAGSAPLYLKNIRGKLYFSAEDGQHGRQLWRSDGTEIGTELVAIVPNGEAPRQFAPWRLVGFAIQAGVNPMRIVTM
ncbi:MAG: hypothetical protein R3E01_14600 [Pirellulaceae bacterium]|nr:hypothetical protein [Planctomycetales bacterium]